MRTHTDLDNSLPNNVIAQDIAGVASPVNNAFYAVNQKKKITARLQAGVSLTTYTAKPVSYIK